MKDSNQNFQINKPCPFYLSDRNKVDGGYYCKSCDKCVVDFRGQSKTSIIDTISKSETPVCGIYDVEIMSTKRSFKWSGQFLFTILTMASFLGFSVKPMNAQVRDSVALKQDTVKDSAGNCKVNDDPKKTDKKKYAKRRRYGIFRRRYILGCIDF